MPLHPAPLRSLLRSVLRLGVVLPLGGFSACWPGWIEIFEQTPSAEHRVSDLRVLAIDVEPASIVVSGALAYDPAFSGSVTLAITPHAFDPRGGDIDLGVSLCAARDPYAPCSGGGIAIAQKVARARADAPLGPVDETFEATLTREQLAQLWADVEAPFPSAVPITVLVNVSVVRTVDGVPEREVAVLALEARVDASSPLVPEDDLLAVSLVRCESLSEDVVCGGEPNDGCGDGAPDPGEACDPPAIDMCSPECQSIAFCPTRLPLACARPVTANQRPLLLGLSVSTDLFNPPVDVAPEFLPGARIPAERGGRISLVPVVRAVDREERVRPVGGVGFDEVPLDGEPPDGAPPGAQCAALIGWSCPSPESVVTRYYIKDGPAEIVAPADELGTYLGNGRASVYGVTIDVGSSEDEVPFVVVLSDGNGGMSASSFTLVLQ